MKSILTMLRQLLLKVGNTDAYFYLALVVKPGLTSQKVFFRERVLVVVFFKTNAQNQKV